MTGENRKLLHSFPWHRTPLGPRDTWPSDMHAVIRMAMYSDFPVATAWGQDSI
jgi:hypothetical protein